MRAALLGLPVALLAIAGCSRDDPPPTPLAYVTASPKEISSVTTLSGSMPASSLAGPTVPATLAPAGPTTRSLAGKKVLHVGDSMVGGSFGLTRALEAKLVEEGAKIVRHTKVSESLSSFDKASTLKDLIRAHHPDIVVITLGANDANVPHPEVHARTVENIVHRVGDRECWWIGPPRIKHASEPRSAMSVVSVIRDHAGPCRFFDSSKLELERTSDGIHPNEHGASKWAGAFWEMFRAPESLDQNEH